MKWLKDFKCMKWDQWKPTNYKGYYQNELHWKIKMRENKVHIQGLKAQWRWMHESKELKMSNNYKKHKLININPFLIPFIYIYHQKKKCFLKAIMDSGST